MGQKPVLSISLLISNRMDTIRKCLDSLKPIMEQIPCELILTDTSKNPKIHQILLEYTDKVLEFEWCNDFAKARNVGLAEAKGEWFLFVDDDEWFVEIDELIHFFQSGEYRGYGCANYIQRNFFDKDFVNYSDSWVSRMVRLNENIHFRSKIHEYLYPAPGRCKNLSAIVHHSGYIFSTEESKRKHFERNSVLLYEMIEEEPDRLRWRVQLAQEFRSVREWEDMHRFCEESLELTARLDNKYDNYDIGTFYVGSMESLLFLKRYEEAIAVGERALQDHRNSEMCRAYIYSCFGVTYFRKGDYAHAEESVRKYLKLGKKINKNPVLLAEQQQSLLVGEALDQITMRRAYSILICAGLKRDDTSVLQRHLKDLDWDQKVIYAFDDIVEVLVDAFARLPFEPVFVETAQLIWNNRELWKRMFTSVQKLEKADPKGFQQVLRVLARVTGERWYLWYAKILVADWDENAEHLQEDLEGFFRNVSNVFLVPGNIIQIAKKYGICVEELYLSTPFERWKGDLRDYISKVSLNDILITQNEMRAMKTRDDIRYEYLFVHVAQAKALFSVVEKDFEKKRQSLAEFAEKAEQFHRVYYQADIVDNCPELLPDYAQAALLIGKALPMEAADPKAALDMLKTAVDVYPSFADAIKSYMRAFGEENRRRERAAKEEMRQLQEKIKAEVYRCMEQKQYETALEILAQLKQLKPNDLELAELSLRIRLAMLS